MVTDVIFVLMLQGSLTSSIIKSAISHLLRLYLRVDHEYFVPYGPVLLDEPLVYRVHGIEPYGMFAAVGCVVHHIVRPFCVQVGGNGPAYAVGKNVGNAVFQPGKTFEVLLDQQFGGTRLESETYNALDQAVGRIDFAGCSPGG